MTRQAAKVNHRKPRHAALALAALLCVALVSGCRPKESAAPLPGSTLKRPPKADSSEVTDGEPRTPPVDETPITAKGSDQRRSLFAQIVEDTQPRTFTESAVIEGAPFKFLLRSLVNVSHDAIRKKTNDQITFDNLMDTPGLHRGQVITLPRGVVLEVSRADVPPEYGLPPGYTILPAVFVDSARDVYALRILCPPGSTLFERLDKGIRDDALPVARVSGYFMKLYARKTGVTEEPPWRRPLLICPELELSQGVPARKVRQEMEESHTDRFMPSERIVAPGAEVRLVIEVVQPSGTVRIDGRDLKGDLKESVAAAVKLFKTRLPQNQSAHPSAVVLVTAGPTRKNVNEVLAALKAAGVQRLALKAEL